MRRLIRFSTHVVLYIALLTIPVLIIINTDDNRLRRFVNETTGRVDCTDAVQFTADTPNDTYRARVRADVDALNSYWRAVFPAEWGRSYTEPCLVQEYEVAAFNFADECGLDSLAAARRNAFYCGAVEGIFWDGPDFMHGMARWSGPSAVTVILAHEYGHWVQDLSNVYDDVPFNVEMQADCYAGAFIGHAIENGYLQNTDMNDIQRVMASFGQPRFTGLWTDITYGNARERNKAVQRGVDRGPGACNVDFADALGVDTN
jgi:predicted metalloprotease